MVAGVGWPTAANVPRQTTFRREETCGIAAAAAIAGICKIKRSEKSSNAANYSKKNIQTAESFASCDHKRYRLSVQRFSKALSVLYLSDRGKLLQKRHPPADQFLTGVRVLFRLIIEKSYPSFQIRFVVVHVFDCETFFAMGQDI